MAYPRMLLILSLAALACSSYRQKYDTEIAVAFSEAAGKSLKVETLWLKPRGEYIHLFLRFTNQYGEPVSVDGQSVTLTFEDEPGQLHNAVKRLAMPSGEKGQTVFIFRLKKKMHADGMATVNVRPRTAGGRVLPADQDHGLRPDVAAGETDRPAFDDAGE